MQLVAGRQSVPGTKRPYETHCYPASGYWKGKFVLMSSGWLPLPTFRLAGREAGHETSSCLFVESHFPECEMSFPPASHNMALFCLIRYEVC